VLCDGITKRHIIIVPWLHPNPVHIHRDNTCSLSPHPCCHRTCASFPPPLRMNPQHNFAPPPFLPGVEGVNPLRIEDSG